MHLVNRASDEDSNQCVAWPQVDECQQQKRQAQAHMGIRLAQFGGASMVELCKKVQRAAGRFHRKPIGPLGAVLALSGPKCVLMTTWKACVLRRLVPSTAECDQS